MSNELMNINDTASDFNIPNGHICTVDLNDARGKMVVAKALNAATSLSEHVGETLKVVDIVTTPGVRSQSNTACTNTYLVLPDGSALFSQSDGVARSAKILVGLWNGDFGEGIDIVCKEVPLSGGRTLKTLDPVF